MSSRREYSKYLAELLLSEDLDARRSGFIRSVIFAAWHEFLEETMGKEALSPEMIEVRGYRKPKIPSAFS